MTQVATVTIQAAQVTADLTDFPLLVDLSDMPAAFWSTVSESGGDIRVFKADGVTELPREVVSCDTATDTGELWVKFAGILSSSSDTAIHIHTGDLQADYAVTDPMGRNAVWSDYAFVLHLSTATIEDATGNYSTAAIGAPTLVASGFGWDWYDFTWESYVDILDSQFALNGTALTLSSWFSGDKGTSDWRTMISNRQTTTSDPSISLGVFRFFMEGPPKFSAQLSGVTHNFSAGTYTAGGTAYYYQDGAVAASVAATPSSLATATINHFFGVARYYSGGSTFNFDGRIGKVRGKKSAASGDWIATEYNNQSAPSTFYTVAGVVTGLTLTSITPTTGPSTGGTTVTMTGTGFEAGTVPKFNGVDATSVVIVSDTELTCVTPAL